jgi:hypothetical protein
VSHFYKRVGDQVLAFASRAILGRQFRETLGGADCSIGGDKTSVVVDVENLADLFRASPYPGYTRFSVREGEEGQVWHWKERQHIPQDLTVRAGAA